MGNSCSLGLRSVFFLYKYLSIRVNLVFPTPRLFLSRNLFLISPLPEYCLFVPFYSLNYRGFLPIGLGITKMFTSIHPFLCTSSRVRKWVPVFDGHFVNDQVSMLNNVFHFFSSPRHTSFIFALYTQVKHVQPLVVILYY